MGDVHFFQGNGQSPATTVAGVASVNTVGTAGRFAREDHAHEGVFSVGVSTGGNTSGNTSVGPGRLVLVGGNNVTLSQATAAGKLMTVTISAGAGGGVPIATAVSSVGSANSVGTVTRYAAEDHVHEGVFSVGVSTGGNTSGDTSVGPGRMVLVGGNNITLSQATAAGKLMSVTISAGTAGGVPIATTVSSVGSANSVGTVTRYAPEDHQHEGLYAAGVSTGGNTAGDTSVGPGRLVLIGGNNITLSQATGAGKLMSVTISAANETQTVPPIATNVKSVASANSTGTITRFAPEDHAHEGVFSVGVSTGGNTAGDTSVGPGRMVLAGGNNVTLSVATAAGKLMTVTISAANETQTVPPIATTVKSVATANSVGTVTRFAPEDHAHEGIYAVGVSTGGNTAGDTTVGPGRFVLVGSNNVTLSVGTAANKLQTITISGPSLAAIATTVSSVGSANSVGTVTRYAAEDHVHEGVFSVGVSTGGNTSGDTSVGPGRMVLIGGNNITLSQGTAAGKLMSVTISAGGGGVPIATTVSSVGSANSVGTVTRYAAEDHVHEGVYAVGVSTGGNTAGNTTVGPGRLVFVGSNNITMSMGTAAGKLMTVTVSGPSLPSIATTVSSVGSANSVGTVTRYAPEDHQHEGVFSVGVSTGGNTSGDTSVGPGRMVLVGGNNITLSMATAAGKLMTVTISAPTPGAGAYAAGVSNLGNTAGTTGTQGNQLVLVGSQGINLSQSANAGSGTVSILNSMAIGVSNTGNTAGNTGTDQLTFVFAGTNNVTISQSTGAATDTIWVSAGGEVNYYNVHTGSVGIIAIENGSIHVFPLYIQERMVIDRAVAYMSFSISTSGASSFAGVLSQAYGIYTMNVSTLSAATTGSTAYQFTNTSSNSSTVLSGIRIVTCPLSATMTPGNYWLGMWQRTSTTNANWFTATQFVVSGLNSNLLGGWFASSAASVGFVIGSGRFSATSSTLNNSIPVSQISAGSTAGRNMPLVAFAFSTK